MKVLIFHTVYKECNTLAVVLQQIKRETERKITQFKSISENLNVYKHKCCFILCFQNVYTSEDSFDQNVCQDKHEENYRTKLVYILNFMRNLQQTQIY